MHQQASRLLRAKYLTQEPVWFRAVLDNPPLPLPPKAPPPRTTYDQKPGSPQNIDLRAPRPLPIYYIEDEIRRQFFRDHPFEAFRPTTLIEGEQIAPLHEVKGKAWSRLRQRGRNPKPEDAVQFALNLYNHHDIPLSEAYARAVAQFRSLRSEHHVATTFAVMEAEELGAVFLPTEIEHGFEKEKRALGTWERTKEMDQNALTARKRWKAIVQKHNGVDQWTKGQEYVRLWREGVKPNYSPLLAEPLPPPSSMGADFLQVVRTQQN